ncbi:hypothetical protein [Companilactobacillus ginsenosidimutans]|uniref:HicB-like antitoxin of toxin-antitoxin system domain-containing protein n=1 Tax=Companilactobacillus ginsenosidimutans TaxID=1007676 RepID=A0A0H4QGI7_9LACO|nr:hypothetical protein [Companilactobacillus ginsenosidimutans]AKP67519.1 hypothetical protein ABM34_08245 [Companilactobacillus ginsenosidimutans]
MIERLTYPAVMHKARFDDKELFHVNFPDLSAANTYGVNLHEAKLNAGILLKLLLDGEDHLPPSSSLTEIQKHYPGSLVSLISVTRYNEEE